MTSIIAGGLVGRFDAAGVLGVADVQAAQQLAFLGGADDPRIALAIALAVRGVRTGSVCVDLAHVHEAVFEADESTVDVSALPWPSVDEWIAALSSSPLVALGPDGPAGRPLRLVGTLLYLERYWRDEQVVRTDVALRRSAPLVTDDPGRVAEVVARVFPRVEGPGGLAPGEPDAQLAAAATAAATRLCVLSGGPGTGKTATVARILVALTMLDPGLHIGLAAPTGKAAARMTEAVRSALAGIDAIPQPVLDRLAGLRAGTVHALLGWRPDSTTRFAHDRWHPLPHDLVVVDEMSMVSLSLMARLLEATRPDARLLLVGDPDQLASVEAGAVFADIGALARAEDPTGTSATRTALEALVPPVDRPVLARPGLVDLRHTWRFGGAIAELAAGIRAGDVDGVLGLLDRLGDGANVAFHPAGPHPRDTGYADLRARVRAWGDDLADRCAHADGPGALAVVSRHRVLCVHRRGPAGVETWNRVLRGWLGRAGTDPMGIGEPLMATRQDRALRVFNGDIGAVLATPSGPRLALAGVGDDIRLLAPMQLSGLVATYASTVHKAQGSQFDQVSVILPDAGSPLLTRELLYTAVTRASGLVHLYGSREAIVRAVSRPANRASGLARRADSDQRG